MKQITLVSRIALAGVVTAFAANVVAVAFHNYKADRALLSK